ncbi:LysR substrate-binding domain-containing protein [Acidisoma sp. C75]
MAGHRTLPPLAALIAFEAAAAQASFSAAARALGLSQAAVSQHVQSLEALIGQPLFRRLHRGVELTEAGERLRGATGRGLDLIGEAIAELRQEATRGVLTIATDFGFASFWLMPRLGALAAALPEIEVRIVTSQNRRLAAAPDADATIAFGPIEAGAERLFTERVLPVCSPSFAGLHRRPGGGWDWAALPLLELETSEPGRWLGWRDWFADARLPRRSARAPMLRFNTYPLVVEAAILGQGAALGWRPLIDRAIAAGLLQPMAAAALTTAHGYTLAIPPRRAARPAVQAFRRWLLAEVGTEMASSSSSSGAAAAAAPIPAAQA